jgi:hypothetical protein
MTTLRIYDLHPTRSVLAFDLRELLDLLAPRSRHANWKVSSVKSRKSNREWFEVTGEASETLEALAETGAQLSGSDLAALAERTHQVIWGEFTASLPAIPNDTWITIRAVDSSFYEIESADETVLDKIRSSFDDIRPADIPIG